MPFALEPELDKGGSVELSQVSDDVNHHLLYQTEQTAKPLVIGVVPLKEAFPLLVARQATLR